MKVYIKIFEILIIFDFEIIYDVLNLILRNEILKILNYFLLKL